MRREAGRKKWIGRALIIILCLAGVYGAGVTEDIPVYASFSCTAETCKTTAPAAGRGSGQGIYETGLPASRLTQNGLLCRPDEAWPAERIQQSRPDRADESPTDLRWRQTAWPWRSCRVPLAGTVPGTTGKGLFSHAAAESYLTYMTRTVRKTTFSQETYRQMYGFPLCPVHAARLGTWPGHKQGDPGVCPDYPAHGGAFEVPGFLLCRNREGMQSVES